jgi:hypothetical protein
LFVDSSWAAQREAITRALIDRHGGRTRDKWIDHRCLFHDDRHRSASWVEATGTYYCRTEDKTYFVPQVLERLSMPVVRSASTPGRKLTQPEALPPITQAKIYTYLRPDGTPSHLKVRWGDGAEKIIRQTSLDFDWRKPADAYPIYGDYQMDGASTHLVVVEGEKCVERIRHLDDHLGGHDIRGVTCGSSADLTSHATDLVARIGEIRPLSITLWPDNDEPGMAAMRALHLALADQNLVHSTIAPAELGLPLKGDVVDFADSGGSLSILLAKQSGALSAEPVRELVSATIVTRDGHMMWPATREPTAINEDWVSALWLHTYGSMASQKQRLQAVAGLRVKARMDPVTVRSRVYTNEQQTWWRPEPTGGTYRISAGAIEEHVDPPGIFLSVPRDDGRHTSTAVNLDGEQSDLRELLSIWKFSDTELAMIEGWLVCAMGSLQTPILLIKSAAGTGKTTLARWLAAVVEPFASEPEARIMKDERQFLRQVMAHPVMLIDNVSRVESAVEDVLARLVTGAAFSIRPLYEDRLVEVFLRRAIILTTTNYEIYKGDLLSRTVVLEPVRRDQGYFADRELQKRVAHLFPLVRGYVLKLLQKYFFAREQSDPETPFRIGDLGTVFAALGYDTAALAEQEAFARSQVVAPNDPWLEAIVSMWKDEDSLYVFKTTQEIVTYLRDYGVPEVPSVMSPRLPRWFAEKAPFFADYGFNIERVYSNPRGYRFRKLEWHHQQPSLLSPASGSLIP